MIQNGGGPSTGMVKLKLRVKNTRVNVIVKNRVHAGHVFSLDDGYRTRLLITSGVMWHDMDQI